MKTTNYVLGFIFDPIGERVVLQKKERPDWQRNKWNGIGGHVEEHESPGFAMQRECQEETGLTIFSGQWQHVCELRGEGFCIYVYATYTDDYNEIQNGEDVEYLCPFPTSDLPNSVIPNLRWMIPMALSLTRGESARSFVVNEQR